MKRTLIYVAIAGVLGIAAAPPVAAQVVQSPIDPAAIPKFVNELPLLGPTGLPVVDGSIPSMLSICEFQTQILPLPYGKTWVWGYQTGDTCDPDPGHSFIGPVVVAQRNVPTNLTFINQLGNSWDSNVLAYTQNTDMTMHWGDPLNAEFNQCSKYLTENLAENGGGLPVGECANNYMGPIPAAIHLHGGEIPPNLDGGPDSWFTFDGAYRGHGYYTRELDKRPKKMPHPDFPAGTFVFDRHNGKYYVSEGDKWKKSSPDRATYVYPNTQEAANIWFHDHVLGFTRLNVYAGIAGAYVLTDPANVNPTLHDPTELVPLVIQDRMFDTNGELYMSEPGQNTTPEHPFWVAEFIGDVAVVNGKVWPTLKVEAKKYRFLFLNGSNSVGYNLQVATPGSVDQATGDFIYGTKGPDMWVIGTDGGYLDASAAASNPGLHYDDGQPDGIVGDRLVLLPGERYEVVIDFSDYGAGTIFEMQNNAWNPYPFGDAPPITQIMQFEVVDNAIDATAGLNDTNFDVSTSPRVHPIVDLNPDPADPAVVHRQLTLNEIESPNSGAPLEALLNNSKWDGHQVIEQTAPPHTITTRGDFVQSGDYSVPTFYSERPNEGSMEVWDIINITADAHPIHLHLVQFQVVERIPFNATAFQDAYVSAFMTAGNPGYMPGYGPPADYNTGQINGIQISAPGVLGGNPDPLQFADPGFESDRGPSRFPEAHEIGWKDTVVTYPGEVTRIAVRFAPTDAPADVPAADLGFPFDPDDGHGYVWHCHILDHEDNEMMRPTEVLPNPNITNRAFVQGIDY